jgi:hypothetical protein
VHVSSSHVHDCIRIDRSNPRIQQAVEYTEIRRVGRSSGKWHVEVISLGVSSSGLVNPSGTRKGVPPVKREEEYVLLQSILCTCPVRMVNVEIDHGYRLEELQ